MIIIKKIIFIILFVLIIFSFSFKTSSKTINDFSKSTIVLDIDNNQILYENNIHNKHLTASIAKIMTCIVAIENGNLNKICKVTEQTINQIGSSIYLKLDDEILLKDLLYGLMLRSGNDAAYLISVSVSENIDDFVILMNNKAKQLNMNSSIFNNPSGLDENTKNYSSAYDMAILMSYAMKNNIFKEIASCDKYSFKSLKNNNYTFINKHKLIHSNKYCVSGKTGYTELAKRTLVSCFSKNNINIVIVTFNCGNDWEVHENLFNYVINNYEKKIIIKEGILHFDYIDYIVTPIIYEDVSYLVKKDDIINCEVQLLNTINNDNIIGIIKLYINNKIVKETFIYRYY